MVARVCAEYLIVHCHLVHHQYVELKDAKLSCFLFAERFGDPGACEERGNLTHVDAFEFLDETTLRAAITSVEKLLHCPNHDFQRRQPFFLARLRDSRRRGRYVLLLLRCECDRRSRDRALQMKDR